MAKYTKLFADYIKDGGSLPTEFALIDDFTDLFKLHFCNYELGFETEALFFMKLQYYATLYVQKYKDRITALTNAWTEFYTPTKTKVHNGNNAFTAGAQHATSTELPFDSATADPTIKNDSEAYTNTLYDTYTDNETGSTSDEAIRRVEFLQREVYNVLEELMDKFNPCFMQVF